jgi:hypothetical protein
MKFHCGKSLAMQCFSFVGMNPKEMLKQTRIAGKTSRIRDLRLLSQGGVGNRMEDNQMSFRMYWNDAIHLYSGNVTEGIEDRDGTESGSKKSKPFKYDNMSKVIDIREYWNGWKGWDTIGEPETDYPNRRFNVVAKDPDSEVEQVFQFTHSDHSMVRSAQRGIEGFRMQVAIRYGRTIRKQGLEYCILGKNDIPEHLSHMCAKLRDTVVIISGESDCVITCYRGKDPFKRIKKKSKRLSPMKTKRA